MEKYEVGRYYNVPCAKMLNADGFFMGYVPVIGEAHKDKQFGVDFMHYHIDGRFSSKTDPFVVDDNGYTNGIINFGKQDQLHCWYTLEIVSRKRKCKRLTTGIKPPSQANKYWDWRNSMLGKSCKGKKCPHLNIEMLDNGNELVCPLHGLIGCKTKEIIVG